MIIEIDPNSGFCFGVVNAIEKAEETLAKDKTLYCIGDIVHNNIEVDRLKGQGLKTINHDEFEKLSNAKVLFRAHGEPPASYIKAKENNIDIIDASCPVVLNLQKRIKKTYWETLENGGQILIYGKKGHAEVNGLVGQTEGHAKVVERVEDLKEIDWNKPVVLFSQTTKTISGFEEITKVLKLKCQNELKINDTICRKVSNRMPNIREFAKKHDVVVFVSGQKSSNGKLLFDVCKQENSQSYFVSHPDELEMTWFTEAKSIGISGATSTPSWLMEQIAENIKLEIK
ncbi:4-hydroxy-3-methylbut-2-enyl diphosphate reductase [Ancylomarina euxinus]|uniref:4-hydroxy-3-methylbut-2-enyl diphosphate reductase n=1 Tax=Ancylomarina euxinus TaxID=2283627 RepID=A0A425Y2W2_9BACT|nr:4-hydroxy-3-methylbut-2-enyl diphosphate reductase [Ancylomarina euxinus]MCZ4693211.1 4-hydroxy-3-methylbut-2-enyl diphosphate reductase [Ancylomarina euxinus]MUP15347.1 4-hydroxy-3-methylbut-2-enyl diphosphate reductase [Ancylomarina euxinus]RRG22528.1 4-hydroxy-3-methylbut-2-enyl diphosphate reductase [Ancylomarina euxinus]